MAAMPPPCPIGRRASYCITTRISSGNPALSSISKRTRLSIPGSLPCNKIFHPLTNLVTNATENRKPFFIASYAGRRRVLKASVDKFSLSGKHRADLFRVIADRNYSIEFLADEFIHRFRPVVRNINPDLPHYLNRLGPHTARLYSGAMRIKGAPAIMSQDAFCHLAPR